MSFLYINPGYAEWLDIATSATTIESELYNPFCGVSFECSVESGGVNIPSALSELYIKCSVYLVSSTSTYTAVYFSQNGSSGWSVNEDKLYKKKAYNSTDMGNALDNGCKFKALNDFLIHLKSGDSSTGKMTLTINNTEILSETMAVNLSSGGRVVFYSKGSYSSSPKRPLSNIIISDSPIACGEKLALLPTTTVDTNMTDNQDGSYSASEAGQYCFQTLNMDSLIGKYGEGSNVKGLFLVGNPAYCTGSEITRAIFCGRKNGTVTEYGSSELGSDTGARVVIGGRTVTTLGDMRNSELGWKAGAAS